MSQTTCKYCHHYIDTTWDECPYCDVTEEEYEQTRAESETCFQEELHKLAATLCTQDLRQTFTGNMLEAMDREVGTSMDPILLGRMHATGRGFIDHLRAVTPHDEFDPHFEVTLNDRNVLHLYVEPCQCLKCRTQQRATMTETYTVKYFRTTSRVNEDAVGVVLLNEDGEQVAVARKFKMRQANLKLALQRLGVDSREDVNLKFEG